MRVLIWENGRKKWIDFDPNVIPVGALTMSEADPAVSLGYGSWESVDSGVISAKSTMEGGGVAPVQVIWKRIS